jgi:hypothetical protein
LAHGRFCFVEAIRSVALLFGPDGTQVLGSTTVVCVVDRNGILAQPFPSVRAAARSISAHRGARRVVRRWSVRY